MIDTLLSRLSRVKSTKTNQWVAGCPAHDDKHPSLAIKLTDDGKILIKCWSGCGIDDICDSIGLKVSDLFPRDLTANYERHKRQYFDAATVLRSLEYEAGIIDLAAFAVSKGMALTEEDAARVSLARDRISAAKAYCFR